jgi:hypothetical protein
MARLDPTPAPTAGRWVLLVAAAVVAALVLLGGGWLAGSRSRASTPTTSPARQAEVFQRGSAVMPFDQAKTAHIFKPLDDGGTISVRYQALANGALLRYTTRDQTSLDALRAWFAAQTSDHGSHGVD